MAVTETGKHVCETDDLVSIIKLRKQFIPQKQYTVCACINNSDNIKITLIFVKKNN